MGAWSKSWGSGLRRRRDVWEGGQMDNDGYEWMDSWAMFTSSADKASLT